MRTRWSASRGRVVSLLGCLLVALIVTNLLPPVSSAVPTLVQTTNSTSTSGTSLSASFASAATAGNLLVVVCATNVSSTITGPSGFTSAINQPGTISQGIFYKIAAGGETAESCSFSGSNAMGIQLYEFSGLHTYTSVDTTASASGTGATASSGTATTTHANDLLLAAIANNDNATNISGWTNSFQAQNTFNIANGPKNSRAAFAGATLSVSSAGSYSTTASGESVAWIGQIVAFREMSASPTLTADIVDGSGNTVANPSATINSLPISFACQTATGTLGSSTQKMRVGNSTDNPSWTLALAATGGNTSVWTAGTNTYAFNNPSGSPPGCAGGQLSVNPVGSGAVAPSAGCSANGVSLGGSSAFSKGVIDAITIASAASPAPIDCTWDVTGVSLSQTVPASQPAGGYSINLTLTVTAN